MIKYIRISSVVLTLITMTIILYSSSMYSNDVVDVSGNEVESVKGNESMVSEDDTTTQGEQLEIETTNKEEEETTTKLPPPPNYIYDKVSEDKDKIVIAGDIDIAKDSLSQLQQLVDKCDFDISIKAVSLDGSKCLSYNSEKEYFAASAIKAPYLLYCYKEIDNGNGTLDEEMVYTSKYYNGGTGTIKDSPSGTSYTLQEIMRRTIWNSDNSGYLMCTERWGKEGYNKLMEQIGAERLKLPNRSIWAFGVGVDDFVVAWKGIYDYFETGTIGAKIFYESTTNCKWNFFGEGIKDCVIAQKYGWADNSFCGAGVVYGKNEKYILAVFTNAEGDNSDKKLYANILEEVHKIMDK